MKNLKLARQNVGKSQSQFAKDLNIPLTTYATYEQNKATPNETIIIKIADYLGCSVDFLFGHQSSGILHLDSLTADQRKLVEMIQKMDPDTTKYLVGYFSNLTQTPLDEIMGSGEE